MKLIWIEKMLKGKHIVVGITGGIAAYKSAVLVRLLVKSGAEVQVIMTPNAREFITPVTLSTLSGRPVISEFFTANTGQWNSHVDLGLWADAFVVAPATASTIAKMATGVADNMLVTSYLSTRAPRMIAPAMDFDMMLHPTTCRNLATLESDGVRIVEAESGELASHLVGKGRMAEPEHIVEALQRMLEEETVHKGTKNPVGNVLMQPLKGKRVLITAGPTRERIDPVRYISNFSTGRMGVALAEEAARRGADVKLVLGPTEVRPSKDSGVLTVDVESAREMLDACLEAFPTADIAIMAAAVADYTVAKPAARKIKREHTEVPTLELVKNPDIAATLGARKRQDQLLVGFALETDHAIENGREKLRRKNLDMVVVNSLEDAGAGFGTDTNRITIVFTDGSTRSFPLKSKADVAADILDSLPEN